MKLFKFVIAATLLAAAGTGTAMAQSTTSFNVILTIEESCEFGTTAVADLDFGTIDRSEVAADSSTDLHVDCTVGTPYTIALDPGIHSTSATASANNRRMQHVTTLADYVAYGLYQDAAISTFWGDGTDSLSYTATTVEEDIPVYGRIATGETNKPAGDYSDTVIATLTL